MEKVFDKNKFDFTTPKTPDDLKPSALRFWANSEAKLLEKIPVKPETPPTVIYNTSTSIFYKII